MDSFSLLAWYESVRLSLWIYQRQQNRWRKFGLIFFEVIKLKQIHFGPLSTITLHTYLAFPPFNAHLQANYHPLTCSDFDLSCALLAVHTEVNDSQNLGVFEREGENRVFFLLYIGWCCHRASLYPSRCRHALLNGTLWVLFFFCQLTLKIMSWNLNETFISQALHISCSLTRLIRKLNIRNANYLATDFAYENDDPTNGSLIIGFQGGWLIYLEIDLIWSAIGNYILFKELSLESCSHINIIYLSH